MARPVTAPRTAGAPSAAIEADACVNPVWGAVENAIEIGARPEVVFDFMTDLRNEPRWNPQMLPVEKLAPGDPGPGT